MLHTVLQNKSIICSGSELLTSGTVMKLHGSDNWGRIIVKTYKEHLLTQKKTWSNQKQESISYLGSIPSIVISFMLASTMSLVNIALK